MSNIFSALNGKFLSYLQKKAGKVCIRKVENVEFDAEYFAFTCSQIYGMVLY